MTTFTVQVPEGTDLSDPYVRLRVETKVKEHHGQTVEVLWPKAGERITEVLAVDARPGAQHVALGADVRSTDGPRVFSKLREQNLQMVEFEPFQGFAIACALDSATVAVRNRLAGVLRCDPWAIEIVLSRVFDERLGRERLDKVCVVRAPNQGIAAEKRLNTWRELIAMLPDGGSGWSIDEDPVSGQVQLSYGTPRRLPTTVSLRDLLPDTLQPDDWANIRLGVGSDGKPVGIDLNLGPMSLVVGPTGSGKSVDLRAHAVSALVAGHQLIIIDTNKSGVDFARLKPWISAFGKTLPAADAILRAVYAEGQRRKEILEQYEMPSWSELPSEVRQRHNIVPLTVMVDEAMSMLLLQPEPKGLDKEHPELVQAREANGQKALILSNIGKMARELRSVGIFLCLAMQRADVGQIQGFGEIRANLTSAIFIAKPGSTPALETLKMTFAGEQTAAAFETLKELDDGVSRGLATIGADGGDVKGFRVAFAPVNELPEILEEIGVPHAEQWDIPGVTSPLIEEPKPFERINKRAPTEVVEVEIGSMDFTLDDLDDFEELDADGDTTGSDARPAPVFTPPTHDFEVV